ncbi:MAG: ATP-binding protein [Roseiflexus sp.]|nr:ATP-binding protein [Roseiflexus sp.]MCS7289188.1 ATP-binding protein [Roseiflexus sp.]MDW8232189.1 ATP-binding protein [Roseiflexaceae bacterium]
MDEVLPYPFLAIVGQAELKTALVLALINPQVGGVLLIGPYGVGKTTAVRGLLDVMPLVEIEETDETGNVIKRRRPMRIIELPLNARMEDVVGGINERVALEQQRVMLEEGVLARAHRNVLYIDEVNLLDAQIVDAILDAAAQGRTFVRRGPMTRLYPSQFVLIGSMNPQEGTLRPQILDRFGLRVWVAPLMDREQRLEIYRRARRFRENPEAFRAEYADETARLKQEIAAAREILPQVTIEPAAEQFAIDCIQRLAIPSHRAEIALFEAARARAAADFRATATIDDIRSVAILALRQRRSVQIDEYAAAIALEDATIERVINSDGAALPRRRPARKKASSNHAGDAPLPALTDAARRDRSLET